MKNLTLTLLAFALLSVPLVAAPATETATSQTADVEAELREELSSLRARLLKLEAMLDSLNQGDEVAAAPVAEPVEAAAEAPVDLAAPMAPTPTVVAATSQQPEWKAPTAISDAEPSQESPVGVASSGGQPISFTGLLDTYYTYNSNAPEDGYNTLYYTNPNSRGFGLNQAKLEIDASGDGPVGFRSDIWFGSGARLFRDGLEPGPLEDVLYIQQAYGYYQFANGAEFNVGAFGTIAGLEVAESHLNWNYTRGILWAWNEPFSHVGAKISTPVSDTVTATFMLVNGFDNAWTRTQGSRTALRFRWPRMTASTPPPLGSPGWRVTKARPACSRTSAGTCTGACTTASRSWSTWTTSPLLTRWAFTRRHGAWAATPACILVTRFGWPTASSSSTIPKRVPPASSRTCVRTPSPSKSSRSRTTHVS